MITTVHSTQALGVHCIGVVGCGTMGQGIAQMAAQGGVRVRIFDRQAITITQAIQKISDVLDQQVSKGRLSQDAKRTALANLVPALALEDLADCDVVVEAIVEDLSIKQALFQQLEDIIAPQAILATNTSSLSVTAVAAGCQRPEQVVGWHFFNPVPLMRIAEVVRGERTQEEVAQRMLALTEALGHRGVMAQDTPGFIVNHAGRAFIPEGLRLLSEGVGCAATIDQVMRDLAGFRMGPLQLLDLIGLDVGQTVMTSLYHQYQEEPRFRITPWLARKVAAGQLGRKNGHGVYSYDKGKAINVVPQQPASEAHQGLCLWVCPDEADLAAEVSAYLLRVPGITLERGPRPSAQAVVVLTPVGRDVSSLCAQHGFPAARTMAIDALFGIAAHACLMTAPGFDTSLQPILTSVFSAEGASVSWLRDSPGFIAQRIVAQIVNIGSDMAQHRLATPQDIDTAVTLALGYPLGPFGWADRLGAARILCISEELYAAYGDPRYRPSIWLRRRAQLGQPLSMPD